MGRMSDMQELIEKPLSPDELASRYRAMCDDPCFANVPGKVELDVWGRVLMTPPPSAYHGLTRGAHATMLALRGSGDCPKGV